MSKGADILIAIACIVGIVAGIVYLNQHVSLGCIFGNCAVIIH